LGPVAEGIISAIIIYSLNLSLHFLANDKARTVEIFHGKIDDLRDFRLSFFIRLAGSSGCGGSLTELVRLQWRRHKGREIFCWDLGIKKL
jgi:hypothetical protein